jgi:hypothetical protein
VERLIDPAVVIVAMIIPTLRSQSLGEVVHDVSRPGKLVIAMAIRLKGYDRKNPRGSGGIRGYWQSALITRRHG